MQIRANKYVNINELIYLIAYCLYIIIRLLEYSSVYVPSVIINLVRVLTGIIIVKKVLDDKKTSIIWITEFAFFVLISLMIKISSDYIYILDFTILVFGAKDIDFYSILKCYRGIVVIFLLFITSFSIMGIIPDYVFYRNDIARHSFGLNYATDYAALLFFVCVVDMCITYRECINNMLKHSVIYFSASIFVYAFCDARLGAGFLILLGIVSISFSINRNALKTVANCSTYILPVCFFVSILLVWFDIAFPYHRLVKLIDKLTGYRLYYSKLGVLRYGYSAFGRYIPMQGASLESKDYFFIDNSYIRILLMYGIVFLCLFVVMYSIKMNKIRKQVDIVIPIAFILIALNSLIGQQLMDMVYNPFLLCLFAQMHKKQNVKGNSSS